MNDRVNEENKTNEETELSEIILVSKKELDEKDELIASLKTKAEKMKSDFVRYKARTQGEEEAIRRKTSGELARQLLSVADTLERAIYSYDGGDGGDGVGGCEVVDRMVEGTRSSMEMTYNQLLNTSGIVPIAPSAGERFDDELHTAIETTQDPLLPDKTILSLVRKGYVLNDELIRPAEVIISSGGGEIVEGAKEGTERAEKAKSGTTISRFVRRFWKGSLEEELREISERKRKLEERACELVRNEETLRSSVKEFDLREKEFGKREEELRRSREDAEPAVLELEQRRKVLASEIRESTGQLSAINKTLNELSTQNDKIVVASIALGRYNEELSDESGKLSNEINEMELRKESLNYELTAMDERKAWGIEEQSKMDRKVSERDEELSAVEREIQKARDVVNAESEAIQELVQRKEALTAKIEEMNRDLELAYENLDELDLKKDKIIIESIALSRYNEELSEERKRLQNELDRSVETERDESGVEEEAEGEKNKKSPFTVSTVFWH